MSEQKFDYKITHKELNEILTYLGKVPAEHSYYLIQYFHKIAKEQMPKAEAPKLEAVNAVQSTNSIQQ